MGNTQLIFSIWQQPWWDVLCDSPRADCNLHLYVSLTFRLLLYMMLHKKHVARSKIKCCEPYSPLAQEPVVFYGKKIHIRQSVHNVNVSSRTSLFFCFSSSEKLTWLCPRGSFWRCFHLIFSVKRFWPEVTDHIRVVFRLTDHLIKLKSIAAAPLALRFCSPLSKVKSLFSKHTSWSRFTLLFSSIDQWITLAQTLENSSYRF